MGLEVPHRPGKKPKQNKKKTPQLEVKGHRQRWSFKPERTAAPPAQCDGATHPKSWLAVLSVNSFNTRWALRRKTQSVKTSGRQKKKIEVRTISPGEPGDPGGPVGPWEP